MGMAREGQKPTVKQLQALMGEMTNTLEQQNQMLRVVFAEVDKLNMVLVRMLDAQGLLHNEACPECDFKINTPLLEDIALPIHCPACQHQLRDEEE